MCWHLGGSQSDVANLQAADCKGVPEPKEDVSFLLLALPTVQSRMNHLARRQPRPRRKSSRQLPAERPPARAKLATTRPIPRHLH